MNTAVRPEMFHDEAAHRLEWRLAMPALIAAAILTLYGLLYHVF